MSHHEAVSDLLLRTQKLLDGCLESRDTGDLAVGAALLASVEAALSLAEVYEQLVVDPSTRCERVQEAYMCTRAAAMAARFAVVAADDRRRLNSLDNHDKEAKQ